MFLRFITEDELVRRRQTVEPHPRIVQQEDDSIEWQSVAASEASCRIKDEDHFSRVSSTYEGSEADMWDEYSQ